MSTFRPQQVPQQPRVFFTPSQPLGSPIGGQDPQRAAYQRQRSEVLQPFQYAVIPLAAAVIAFSPVKPAQAIARQIVAEQQTIVARSTAGQPLGVPAPRSMDQSAAYQRTVTALPYSLPFATTGAVTSVPASVLPQILVPPRSMVIEQEEVTPFLTTGFAVGVPPARNMDQTAAYWRQAPQPIQGAVQVTIGITGSVPYAIVPMIIQPQRPMIIEIEETLPYLTGGFALSVPPSRLNDQTPAYWRTAQQPLQLQYQSVQAGIVQFVPYLSLQTPAPTTRSQTAELIEALSEAFVPAALAPVPVIRLQLPVSNRQDTALLQGRNLRTTGFALSVPPARPVDQSAAYFRWKETVVQPPSLLYFMQPQPLYLVGDPRFVVGAGVRNFTVNGAVRDFTVRAPK